MTIETIESAVRRIAAKVLGLPPADVSEDTAIPGSLMHEVNDDVCLELNINISTSDAGQCRTVGEYIELVTARRESV